MLFNYFTIAWRQLRRNGRFLLINTAGLGIALGFCILAYLNHRFANTFDHWHRDADRIVRVEMVKAANGLVYGVCPGALGPAAKADISAVEDMTRYDAVGTVVKNGDQVFNENLYLADAHFFRFFDFDVKYGVADLSDRSKVLIDEDTAEKYFGAGNPVGRQLIFYADTPEPMPLTVGAVLKNIPLNSSLRFRCITHLDNGKNAEGKLDPGSWARSVAAVFLKLKNAGDLPETTRQLVAYQAPRNSARSDWQVSAYVLQPLRALALSSRQLRGDMLWQGVPPAAVWGNVVIAALLLLTAMLNFSNMTISISNRRLREMGVRKVLGGSRYQLMRQILGETLVVVLFSTVLGMALALPFTEWFNSTWKFTDLKADYSDPTLGLYIAVMMALTTLLAGSYPAFYISGFKPARIFRGGVQFGGDSLFSRIMMGMQVGISVMAVVVGISFAYNAEYNRNSDIGFDYQPVLQAWLPATGDYQRFVENIQEIPGIETTAASVHLPGFGFDLAEFKFQEQSQEAMVYDVGNGFNSLMQMRLHEGAWPVQAGDTTRSPEIVVNQTLARRLSGNQSPVGATVQLRGQPYRISGIVHDFMTNTPFNPISPAVLRVVPDQQCRRCLIRTRDVSEQPQVMAHLEKRWAQLFPYTPFNVGYQNEMLRDAIEVSDNIAKNMAALSLIAVLLSITGLFSLTSLQVLRRMREIAIRRVLGASATQVGWILNRQYVWIFAFALSLGCMGGYLFSKALLDSIFRISAGVQLQTLIYGPTGILSVAVATIVFKLWQTLRVNPADVLRGE
jgi:putative ABC transport system permease protein